MSIETIKPKPVSSTGNEPRKNVGPRRVINAFFHSMDGLAAAFKHEAAFRQEVILFLVLLPVALVLPVSPVERALLVLTMLMVMVAELLNSAVEWVVDYVSLEKHPFAKKAKDMGSAAVLVGFVAAISSWSLIIHANWSAILAKFQ